MCNICQQEVACNGRLRTRRKQYMYSCMYRREITRVGLYTVCILSRPTSSCWSVKVTGAPNKSDCIKDTCAYFLWCLLSVGILHVETEDRIFLLMESIKPNLVHYILPSVALPVFVEPAGVSLCLPRERYSKIIRCVFLQSRILGGGGLLFRDCNQTLSLLHLRTSNGKVRIRCSSLYNSLQHHSYRTAHPSNPIRPHQGLMKCNKTLSNLTLTSIPIGQSEMFTGNVYHQSQANMD